MLNPAVVARRLALVLAAVPALALAQQSSAYETRVDSLFSQYTRDSSPGLSVIFVRDGKVVLSKGYGFADLEHRVPITSSTVFDLASVSKQFTGFAVAVLVGQGRIKLTDDIRKYLPEMSDIGQTITIEHLVHHTSGIRDWPVLTIAGWQFDDVLSFDQILRFAYKQRSLNFVPGAEYSYSNTEYNLLVEIIQRVTGQPFRTWTDEHFFTPLGMTSTHFQFDHARLIPNRAFGYRRQTDGTFSGITDNLEAPGSSSLFSSVDDMGKWVMNFDDAKVGGAAAIALARTPGVLNDGTSISYAFGISGGQYRGLPTVSHSGGWAGFSTEVLHFPSQHAGVVVLSNGGVNATRAAQSVADIYLGSEMSAPNAAGGRGGRGGRGGQTAVAESGAPAADVPAAILDRYAGLYRLGPARYVRIRRDAGVLKAQVTGEAESPMRASSPMGAWVDGSGAPMTFQTSDGQPASLVYRRQTMPKLDESRPPAALAEFIGEYENSEIEVRYRVEIKNGALAMWYFKYGSIPLARVWNDDFTGSLVQGPIVVGSPAWFAHSIEFQRDASGKVNGFLLNIDERSRNIRFVKR